MERELDFSNFGSLKSTETDKSFARPYRMSRFSNFGSLKSTETPSVMIATPASGANFSNFGSLKSVEPGRLIGYRLSQFQQFRLKIKYGRSAAVPVQRPRRKERAPGFRWRPPRRGAAMGLWGWVCWQAAAFLRWFWASGRPTSPFSPCGRGGQAHRGRFFGKLLRAIFRFRLQDAPTPPSPLVG